MSVQGIVILFEVIELSNCLQHDGILIANCGPDAFVFVVLIESDDVNLCEVDARRVPCE